VTAIGVLMLGPVGLGVGPVGTILGVKLGAQLGDPLG